MTMDPACPAGPAPILRDKHYATPSAFTPESLLREARRQKGLAEHAVPPIGVLDPDGDLVRYLAAQGLARPVPQWACYHTDLYRFVHEGVECGIVGRAVGAAFAVLVAEELFASGCRLLISVTSAGQLTPIAPPPYFVLIERALRDEGTSYHYLPPGEYSEADSALAAWAAEAVARCAVRVERGGSWTTDAPFRETAAAIEARRAAGLLAVEMEAAALYAFAHARQVPVLCFAHVTNQMGRFGGDFEKGESEGARDALAVIGALAARWASAR
jgi:uridine phosphorylase